MSFRHISSLRPWIAGVATAGLTSLAASPSPASLAPIHQQLAEAQEDLARARGPVRYTELRELWGLWDETDPQQVEQALRTVQSNRRFDPATKAYAGLLAAYARRRRGDLNGARDQIAALGYVDEWLTVGPFDNEGRTGLDRVFDPEANLQAPLDLQRPHEGKERPVRWREVPDIFPYGWLDFGDLMRPEEKICAYASTFVRSKRGAAKMASVWLGATGAFRLFWNGEEILSDSLYRHLDANRFASSVRVQRGWNRLTVKVCGDATSPMLTLRLADRRGAPDDDLDVSANPDHAAAAADNAVQPETDANKAKRVVVSVDGQEGSVRASKAPPVRERDPGRLRGPVGQFDRMVKGKNPRASVLEDYARYLMRTGGDDPAKHVARDYAVRAAEKSPTIERALLAASLSEDRNQTREWVAKAAEIAGDHPPIEVLLAQAQLARSGPNWRDAVPFYDHALEIDPDRVEALLGRVDLYNEAGLRRTALRMLERAVERAPRAVGLLRVYALQLASLGRQSEAEEVGARYAAFRFDDPTKQVAQIHLAVSRRQDQLARHWIDRLLDTDPDSSYHLGVAARAYLSMGQPDKAIATYQQALDMAPEDTGTMRELADLFGKLGQRQQQIRLLRKILVLRPQYKDIREYVEHIEPKRERADEAYAWAPEQFLPLRTAPAKGFNQRTLRDLQVTTVYPSGLSSTFRQVVFQPLTDEAAASAREYAFAFQADREVVQLRAARVYRTDGGVDETVETGEGPADNPAIAMYTSARMFYVQFPRLEVGDVVELRYRIEEVTSRNVFADYFGEVFHMQSSEPTRNAEYVVIAPKSRQLVFRASTLPGLQRDQKEKDDRRIYRFYAPQVAPVLPEPQMPSWSEELAHVHVSTYEAWKDVGSWYWGLAKEQLHPDDSVREKALELTKGLKTDEEKVRAIYGWVVKRTRYVALEFGIYGYKPRRASQTLARGWGDCKDKAALIVSMLRVLDIPANMVIVRSSLRGAFPTEPASLAPFDHAIAYVPSLDLYLDGTAEYTGSTELPAFDRGSMALIVRPDTSELVTLPDPPASETRRAKQLRADLQSDGSAKVSMDYEVSGAIAPQWRIRYHGESTQRDRIAADMAQNLPGFVLTPGKAGVKTNDFENIEQPVQLSVRGSSPSFARRQEQELSVPVTPADRFVGRFASLSKRSLDVVLPYRWTIDETWTVELPGGSKVREMPKAASVSTRFGSMKLDVNRNGQTVEVQTLVQIDDRRITPKEYDGFVKFCEEVDRALNQRLIVRVDGALGSGKP